MKYISLVYVHVDDVGESVYFLNRVKACIQAHYGDLRIQVCLTHDLTPRVLLCTDIRPYMVLVGIVSPELIDLSVFAQLDIDVDMVVELPELALFDLTRMIDTMCKKDLHEAVGQVDGHTVSLYVV